MLKFFIVILSMLFVTSPTKSNDILFKTGVDAAYEKYAYCYEYSNENFSLSIVKGIVNDKPAYGFALTNVYVKTYTVKIVDIDGNEYKLSPNSRGDLLVVAFEEIDKEYTINIYRDGKKVDLLGEAKLTPFTESEFDDLPITAIVLGKDQGTIVSKLVIKNKIDSSMLFIIIGVSLITLGCLIIILSYMKNKKGMFDKNKRSEGIFQFKDFLSQNFDEEPKSEFDVIDIKPEENQEEEEIAEKAHNEIYQKSVRYDNEEKSNFPLEEYLKDKGFVTDYKLAQEEEKQKIMLELMKLKNDKKITEDEYLEEAYKLWKE